MLIEPAGILLLLAIGIAIGLFLFLSIQSRRKSSPFDTYNARATELYTDITYDVKIIRDFTEKIKDWKLRQQLNLICEDIITLLDKVAEKAPESRMTTGKFVRGHLEFIINDILPQYIEMQDTPRYYESTKDKMENGHQAIRTFGTFLHNRIVELEIGDEMRYEVAIEMLKSLYAYTNQETEES